MKIVRLKDCAQFIAGDDSLLQEILNPKKGDLKINYSLARAIIKPGQKTKPHRLKSTEVYHIVRGIGIMHIDKEENVIKENYTVYIPKDSIQWLENIGKKPMEFLCIVDPAWEPSCEEVIN